MRPLSARNPRVRHLAKLARSREDRTEERAFVVEGPILVRAALDAGADLAEVFVDEAAADRPAVASLIDALPASISGWLLPPGVLDRAGDATTSQGVLAIVRRQEPPWPTPDEAPFVLVLEEIGDPGNAGTLLRAAAASGADMVVVAGGTDPTGPKAVRASAGAVFTVPVVVTGSGVEAVARLRALGYRVLATSVHEGEPYDRVDLAGPLAIVLGNEARGVTPEVLALADAHVTIPMAGPAESLNVAMAGTIVCFEVLRRARS